MLQFFREVGCSYTSDRLKPREGEDDDKKKQAQLVYTAQLKLPLQFPTGRRRKT